MTRRALYLGLALVLAVAAAWLSMGDRNAGPDLANLAIPAFTEAEQEGRTHFEANCATCHGPNATGTEQGPPLVHIIYEPGHHADITFTRAVSLGVRAHHWRFGDMPAIEGVPEEEVIRITAYVRALQRANGIH